MIDRTIENQIVECLFQGKAILLTGPRQVGKTTLIQNICQNLNKKILFLDGDDPLVRSNLDTPNTQQIADIIQGFEVVFIDEAQRINNIGLTAKIIADQFKSVQLILSGSSAFQLNSALIEPLTGRKFTFQLYPISWAEYQDNVGFMASQQGLESRLIYGSYPEIITHSSNPERRLNELVESYLYKDVLTYANLRKPEVIQKLIKALAYQVGNELVLKEVGDLIGLDPKTVNAYIDILEQAFVVFRLPAFSRNLRNEIKTNKKIYFYDNGVRNASIGALQPLNARNDIGALWENFLIAERVKLHAYQQAKVNLYFWRTKQQQEVDLVEEFQQNYKGFEFKWNANRKVKLPQTFVETYQAESMVVTKSNFREFIMPYLK
jgi:uncharacterized protein